MHEDKALRMRELVEQLNKASEIYYQKDSSLMTDYEYDRLYDELVKLERETGETLPDSPTINVGYKVVSNLAKVRHESPMLSLDKTKSVEQLQSFLGSQQGMLSLKLDGLTVAMSYQDGRLQQAVTRGNGEVGEDITHNARVFRSLPKSIPFTGRLVVRGEAVISFKEFNRINGALDESDKYKNPRNLTSGSVRQLNSRIAAARNVDFLSFTLVSAEGKAFKYKSEAIEWLKEQGFSASPYKRVTAAEVSGAVTELTSLAESYDYACDGLVLTYDDIDYSSSLGRTSKFPRDSVAFKWADERAETTLKEILWNTSRTGLINPIAIFEPVELEGTTVERASLHNLSIVEALELGEGDRITVYKANMIIPQVAENLTRSNTARPPEECPQCGNPTHVQDNDGVKVVYCHNPNCRARLVQTLAHYSSRDAMNIEGFSEQTAEKFIERGFVKTYADIYELESYHDEITSEKGFGEKSFTKLMAAIESSKNAVLPNFIYALGIDNVGLANAKLLCKYFSNDIGKIRVATVDDLLEIEGFGGVIAAALVEYFANEQNIAIMEKALSYLTFAESGESSEPQTLAGKTFVITGDTHIYDNRRELKAVIDALGGKVAGSVSSKTDYLINNDVASSSGKNKKAQELNIPIINEEEFEMLKNNGQ